MINGASNTPAAAASPELIAHTSENVWLTLIPTRSAASRFSEVASIPFPSLVLRKNSMNAQTSRTAMVMMLKLKGVIATPAMRNGSADKMDGKRLTSEPRRIRTPARIICPTATVARISVTTGAFNNGR